jgi:glutathione S-transferase
MLATTTSAQALDRRLVVLSYSPWSERARWALDHHGLAYREIQHYPMVGELRLRRIVGRGPERATVPVLLADGKVLNDTWDIAVYADRHGTSAKLIPADLEGEVRRIAEIANRAMQAGRALLMATMLTNGEALDETLPPQFPKFIRPLMRPIARFGARWFSRKYELDLAAVDANDRGMRIGLDGLRSALASSGSGYVLARFSYADVVMASMLQGIAPVPDRYIPLGRASRRVWTRENLAADYADLVAWRDGLYAAHRGAKG